MTRSRPEALSDSATASPAGTTTALGCVPGSQMSSKSSAWAATPLAQAASAAETRTVEPQTVASGRLAWISAYRVTIRPISARIPASATPITSSTCRLTIATTSGGIWSYSRSATKPATRRVVFGATGYLPFPLVRAASRPSISRNRSGDSSAMSERSGGRGTGISWPSASRSTIRSIRFSSSRSIASRRVSA